jgi:hypothetical protein
VLEDRLVPTAAVTLGDAGQFAVLGLRQTQIDNGSSTVTGNEGVSRGGNLNTTPHSAITGNVDEYARNQVSGRGHVGGNVVTNPALLTQSDSDALNAAAQATALAPTQTLKSVSKTTTVVGNGGLNVIDVKGDIQASLILSGGANDVFIVNVTGSLRLVGHETLGLAGGVTAAHVLYNFTGRHGQVSTQAGNVVDGTLLAPQYNFHVGGAVQGEIIGGGAHIELRPGATVNQVNFQFPSAAPASLSGFVTTNSGSTPLAGAVLYLTTTNSQGQTVTVSAKTDSTGHFQFTGLQAGVYTLSIVSPPSGYVNSTDQVGTVNGVQSGTALNAAIISGINLVNGGTGANYNFGEQLFAGS